MKRIAKILVAEDLVDVRERLCDILSANNYEALPAGTAAEVDYAIKNETFDLVLLDLLLPDGSGFDLLKKIRKLRGNVPVIVQTALGGDEFCIRALKFGADDYLVKPLRQGPMIARIEAVLRRSAGTPIPFDEIPLRNGAKAFYSQRELVFADGTVCSLTFKEAALLRFLFSREKRSAGTEEILVNVWHATPYSLDASCVPALVSRLRKKLGECAEIRPIHNGGYILKI